MNIQEAAATRQFIARAFVPFGSDVSGFFLNLPQPSVEVTKHENALATREISELVASLPDGWGQHVHDRAVQYQLGMDAAGRVQHPVGIRPLSEDFVAFFFAMLAELQEAQQ